MCRAGPWAREASTTIEMGTSPISRCIPARSPGLVSSLLSGAPLESLLDKHAVKNDGRCRTRASQQGVSRHVDDSCFSCHITFMYSLHSSVCL